MSIAAAENTDDIASYMQDVGRRARACAVEIARADTEQKNRAMAEIAAAIERHGSRAEAARNPVSCRSGP